MVTLMNQYGHQHRLDPGLGHIYLWMGDLPKMIQKYEFGIVQPLYMWALLPMKFMVKSAPL